jgi:hypothetical protein
MALEYGPAELFPGAIFVEMNPRRVPLARMGYGLNPNIRETGLKQLVGDMGLETRVLRSTTLLPISPNLEEAIIWAENPQTG